MRMLQDEGSAQTGPRGPKEVAHTAPVPGRVAHPFCPSGLRSLASFAPRSSSFQNNDPRKFIAYYDVIKVLKQIKKEIGVFCLRRINSIKRGNHY